MPSPPATLKPYMNGVYIAYAIVSWCYCELDPPVVLVACTPLRPLMT